MRKFTKHEVGLLGGVATDILAKAQTTPAVLEIVKLIEQGEAVRNEIQNYKCH